MDTGKPQNTDQRIAKRLHQARRRAGLSQREAGDRLGVRHTTISQYETGKRLPDAVMIERLAELYGVSVAYLYGETDAPAPSATISVDWPGRSKYADQWDKLGPEAIERARKRMEEYEELELQRAREERRRGPDPE